MQAEAIAPKPPTLVHRPENYFVHLDVTALFPKAQPLEVELGFGDGGFLLEWAKAHPEHNFLGVERLLGRFRKLDRKGLRAGLRNLRLVRIEASYFIAHLLPPASAVALHVYFPDPWPKRRHKPRRLINAAFAETAAQLLAAGGLVFLRTDDADYFRQMKTVFVENPAFLPAEAPAHLLSVQTDFERDFQARGIQTLQAAYRRR